MKQKEIVNMPLSKGKNAGKVRPYVTFEPDEYKEMSKHALNIDMEKGKFIHDAVMYIVKKKIDPRK